MVVKETLPASLADKDIPAYMREVCERSRRNLLAKKGLGGFIIHPRGWNDILLQFPGLVTVDPVKGCREFEELDPFVICNYTGLKNQQGEDLPCFLFCAPFLPEHALADPHFAQRQIIKTARIAKEEYGVELIGLGEFTAMLTRYGQDIEREVPGMYATSGHGNTVNLISEIRTEVASILDIDLRQSTLAVVGAAGSIGSTCAQLFKDDNKRMILIDRPQKIGRSNKYSKQGNIQVTSDLTALKEADFIICATTAPKPIIFRDQLSKGAVIIDDSQPPNISREEAESAQALIVHPIARTGMARPFDYGLPTADDWACVAEMLALIATRKYDLRTIGPVRPENVEWMRRLSQEVGFRPAPLQAFGEYITKQQFDKIRAVR
ncbi:hypothetical protein HY439_00795 [Candidatus Microgenomates bacterium]|nr:hypothetical protein [Candidatus Microgenomates bacterium]